MALNNISELSTTASSNSDFAGTSILGTGLVSTADDSFRNLGSFLAKWWNDLGAINTVTGTGDAIAVTTLTVYTALKTGMFFRFVAGAANTTATTLNLDAIGAKAVRKISGGTDVALVAGDLAAGETYTVVYRSTANAAAGAWVIVGAAAVADATTSTKGKVQLGTLAQTLSPPAASSLVPTIGNLYFPTGHLWGLTLSNNAGDATNDIDIALGTCRDATDSINIVQAAAMGKQLDVAWAVGGTTGSTLGGLDTGAVGNNKYYIWKIIRSDTLVNDVLFSLSSSAPTMPTNYDYKRLIGEVTRAGGVNGPPLWYGPTRASTGYAGITLGTPTASTSGTSIDFTGLPTWVKRVTVNFAGVSTSGISNPLVQIGDAGGIEASGYVGSSALVLASSATQATAYTAGFGFSYASGSVAFNGTIVLTLVDPATATWVASGGGGFSGDTFALTVGGSKSLSPGPLDRVRITTVGGTDTFDAGKINITYE